MRSGTSQYSRPTTGKKLIPSPKIPKKEENTKMKTEQNEMDYDKLYELMYPCADAEKRPSRGRKIARRGASTSRRKASSGR